MKNKKDGVTLVALVITIIVLLILAGVSFQIVIDSDNVFERAAEASGKWNNDVNYENDVMVKQVENVIEFDIENIV